MKKLTKNILSEMLKNYIWLGNYDSIAFAEKRIYINTTAFTIVIWYGTAYGWNFVINGNSNYLVSKYAIKLCDDLEKGFSYYDNSK